MRFSTVTCGLAAILPLALAGAAPKVTDNPTGTQYIATLPSTNSTAGTIMIGPGPAGNGAVIQVSISGLPVEGGPFLYHIHEKSIDSTGNCSTAGGHLDPYGNGGTGCNTSDTAYCEVGDLSGKHGKMQGESFSANYVDDYISVKPGADEKASVVGRSIVLHFGNKTAITCANLTLNGAATGGNGESSSVASNSGSSSSGGQGSGSASGSSGNGAGNGGANGAPGSGSGSPGSGSGSAAGSNGGSSGSGNAGSNNGGNPGSNIPGSGSGPGSNGGSGSSPPNGEGSPAGGPGSNGGSGSGTPNGEGSPAVGPGSNGGSAGGGAPAGGSSNGGFPAQGGAESGWTTTQTVVQTVLSTMPAGDVKTVTVTSIVTGAALASAAFGGNVNTVTLTSVVTPRPTTASWLVNTVTEVVTTNGTLVETATQVVSNASTIVIIGTQAATTSTTSSTWTTLTSTKTD